MRADGKGRHNERRRQLGIEQSDARAVGVGGDLAGRQRLGVRGTGRVKPAETTAPACRKICVFGRFSPMLSFEDSRGTRVDSERGKQAG